MQNNADYITVTVKDLGRNFNKDDFYVGQIIDLRRENRSWQEEKFTVRNLDDTSIYWAGTPPHFWARIAKPWHMKYDSIYSVRYYKEKKNPKSAMKKSKFKMQNICKCESAVKCRRGSKCSCKYCPYKN